MSFDEMTASLEKAYAENVARIRMRQLMNDGALVVGEAPVAIRVPVLSGPPGIGKTTCVRQFAQAKGFQVVELDCAYMSPANMATIMFGAAMRISSGAIPGCVILIGGYEEMTEDCGELIVQYANNYFDADVLMTDDESAASASPVRRRIGSLPETLFLVCEQTTS